jgi:hypothetical protein
LTRLSYGTQYVAATLHDVLGRSRRATKDPPGRDVRNLACDALRICRPRIVPLPVPAAHAFRRL